MTDPLRQLRAEASAAEIRHADYRKIVIEAQDIWPDGTVDDIQVETLQPWQWIDAHEVHVGGQAPLPLDVVEMGLPEGITGTVRDILPCPPFRAGRGRVIVTTVNHLNRNVWELALRDRAGAVETVRPTGAHLFYSHSRGQWLAASELQAGERLDGVSGPVAVVSTRRLPGTHRVYNFTVQGEHLYRVAQAGVLVHNNGCAAAPATAATAEEAASGASLRLQYMGRTPGKLSRTGLEVQARAQAEGNLVRVGDRTMVRYYDPASSRNCWTDIANTDMAHRVDAVSWWNSVGVKYGPKAPEVRSFMLDPKNYELQPYWINRSKGALLTERYQQF
jgi:hypothetical protein